MASKVSWAVFHGLHMDWLIGIISSVLLALAPSLGVWYLAQVIRVGA